MRRTKAVEKFLERHAEDAAALGTQVRDRFRHAVVIPSYAEGERLDAAIESIPVRDDAPVIAVVNINAKRRSPREVTDRNAATAKRLRDKYPQCQQLDEATTLHDAPFGKLALLQRTLPNSQGVGLARKHGTDFAVGLWAEGRLESDWIHCTDADVRMPADYFSAPAQKAAAMLLHFRHLPDRPGLERSARIYDAWLRSYVLGLTLAGSPYAFHTIGSTVAVDAASYAAVRGFPRRNAAEDFYLLNKLAKQGPIIRSPASPILLAARLSDRVPFGTGRAMSDANDGGETALPFFYDATLYLYLKALLRAAERRIADEADLSEALKEEASALDLATRPLLLAVSRTEFDIGLENAMNSAAAEDQKRRAFHNWFDAFRTMKFIHSMRDAGLESDPWDIAAAGMRRLLDLDDEWTADDRAVLSDTLADLSPEAASAVH